LAFGLNKAIKESKINEYEEEKNKTNKNNVKTKQITEKKEQNVSAGN
jgi:hypothetical protein